jgi:hypothetical protein
MKEVLLNICLVAVATGLFKLLAPKKGFRGQINFLISCFFIVSVIHFISSGKYEFSELAKINETVIVDFSGEALNEERTAIAAELNRRLTEKFKEKNIAVKKIAITVNISADKSISIEQITIYKPQTADDTQESKKEQDITIGDIVKTEIGDVKLIIKEGE